MFTKSTSIAAAAAAAALYSVSALAATAPDGSSGLAIAKNDTVHCYGLNSCKGSSECATTKHACKGQNSCKNDGFKAMKAGQCLSKGGTIADIK